MTVSLGDLGTGSGGLSRAAPRAFSSSPVLPHNLNRYFWGSSEGRGALIKVSLQPGATMDRGSTVFSNSPASFVMTQRGSNTWAACSSER